MNRLFRFAASLLAAASISVALPAGAADDAKKSEGNAATKEAPPPADVTGNWILRITSPRGVQEPVLKLEKAGDKYVGALTDPRGQVTPVKEIQYKDGELTFQVVGERQGQKFALDYTAHVTGEKIKGKMSVRGRNFSINIDGHRESPIEGVWKINFTLESGQKLGASIKVKQNGDKLDGDFVGITGNKTKVKDIKFKDGEIAFDVADQVENKKDITFHYTGKVVADKINGTVAWAGDGNEKFSFKFDAEKSRAKTADVNGVWKLKVPMKNGPTFEPTIKLTQTGGAVVGTYTGEQGDTPLNDALVMGDEFTFEVNRQKDGKSYKLRYQGKVDGDTLKGDVDYNFDGISGFYSFEGKRVAPAGTPKQ